MTEQVERVAKAIRDQNRFHMQRQHPGMTFDRDTVTADELRLARAAIAALTVTPQEAAKVLLAEWTEHGEGPLGDLCCYSMNDEGRMVPDVDGRWVEFAKIEAALFRAISEDRQ